MSALLVLVFLAAFIWYLYNFFVENRKNLPPGPILIPFFGNILQLDHVSPQNTLAKWGQKYGPVFTCWFGTTPYIFVTDYKILKDSFIKEGSVFAGRTENLLFKTFSDHSGIVFSDGQMWKGIIHILQQRRFTLHTLRDFGFGKNLMQERVLRSAQFFADELRNEIKDGGKIVQNLNELLQFCIGSIISSVLIGHSFEDDRQQFYKLKSVIDDNIRILARPEVQLLAVHPWLRFIPIFDHFGYGKFKKNCDFYHDYIYREIKWHKEKYSKFDEVTDYTAVYLREMKRRRATKEDRGYFSEHQLAMNIGDLYAAGIDTSFNTTKWGILYLSKYPDVQKKCRQELTSLLESRNENVIGMEDLKNLPYFLATVQEIQRCANLLPINLEHRVTENTKIGDFLIPKDTVVVPQISAVMMNDEVFPNPAEFNPGRFLDADGEGLKKVDELMPFSLGKRQCLGESLARMELHLILARLIQEFEFCAVTGTSLEAKAAFLRSPKSLEVFVKKAEK